MPPPPPLTIQFLPPSPLDGYNRSLPSSAQPSIPSTFLSAMEVRTQVFVNEQKVPADNEFDSDDSRSCHWVAFTQTSPSSQPTPIATIRLVPPPHPPHPLPGSTYAADALETAAVPVLVDRATTFHDGREKYVKVGRMAVLSEWRGCGVAGILVREALKWAGENQETINKMGSDEDNGQGEQWKGLICVHSQVQVEDVWARWGFKVDEGMGMWVEEGINHVGMFMRVPMA